MAHVVTIFEVCTIHSQQYTAFNFLGSVYMEAGDPR